MAGLQSTQIFSYEELEEATDGFSPSKELGDGGFGAVYKGIIMFLLFVVFLFDVYSNLMSWFPKRKKKKERN